MEQALNEDVYSNIWSTLKLVTSRLIIKLNIQRYQILALMLGVNGLCKQNSAEVLQAVDSVDTQVYSIVIGTYINAINTHVYNYTCTDSLTPSSLFLRPGKCYIVEIWHVDTVLQMYTKKRLFKNPTEKKSQVFTVAIHVQVVGFKLLKGPQLYLPNYPGTYSLIFFRFQSSLDFQSLSFQSQKSRRTQVLQTELLDYFKLAVRQKISCASCKISLLAHS